MEKEIHRIIHISASSPFMDESTYQETMLANEEIKKHPFVSIIATNIVFEPDGSKRICKPCRYRNSSGVQIIRFNSHKSVGRSKGNFIGLYRIIKELSPDFIMDHVFCPTSCIAICLYVLRNRHCKVVADSHITRQNYNDTDLGVRERFFNFLLRIIGKFYYRQCDRIYGITDQTIDMISGLFGVPREKTELLPLGFDGSFINFDDRDKIRASFRKKYGITDKTSVLVHGGKLVRNKKTLELVEAVKNIPNVVLIVFGEFSDKTYETMVKETNSTNVIYLGYLSSKEIYDVYFVGDIAVFPGAPSCLRQEAVASGLPIIYYPNEGDEGINLLMKNNGMELPKNWDIQDLVGVIVTILNTYDSFKTNAMDLALNEYKKYSYSYEAEYVLYN